MAKSRADIEADVRDVLVDALGVDEDDVVPTATLKGDLGAWFGSVPAVPAACKGNALLTDAGCATNGFDNFDKIWFWRTTTSKCEAEGNCIPYSQWDKAYRQVMGQ